MTMHSIPRVEHIQFLFCVGRRYSHGEVGDEGSFGNLNIKHDILRLRGVVHYFGLDHGGGHTRSNSGLDFVAIKSYLINIFLQLARKGNCNFSEKNDPELHYLFDVKSSTFN